MTPSISKAAIARLTFVAARIKMLELRYLKTHKVTHFATYLGWSTMVPIGPKRQPIYRSTPPLELFDFLTRMSKDMKIGSRLSHSRAADLGAGFGASSAALAEKCKSVTAFEFHGPFTGFIRTIRRDFGYRNLRVSGKDFVTADLSKFNLWYIYAPFMENYGDVIGAVLRSAKKGDMVITNTVINHDHLPLAMFARFYPLDPRDFHYSSIRAYIRY